MTAGNPPGSKEITDLLSKLKAVTPDYPADRLAARKSAFLKHAAALYNQLRGWNGKKRFPGSSGE